MVELVEPVRVLQQTAEDTLVLSVPSMYRI